MQNHAAQSTNDGGVRVEAGCGARVAPTQGATHARLDRGERSVEHLTVDAHEPCHAIGALRGSHEHAPALRRANLLPWSKRGRAWTSCSSAALRPRPGGQHTLRPGTRNCLSRRPTRSVRRRLPLRSQMQTERPSTALCRQALPPQRSRRALAQSGLPNRVRGLADRAEQNSQLSHLSVPVC